MSFKKTFNPLTNNFDIYFEDNFTDGGGSGPVYATEGQTVFNFTDLVFPTNKNDFIVEVDNIPANKNSFTRTGESQITFTSGLTLNQKVVAYALGKTEVNQSGDTVGETYIPVKGQAGFINSSLKETADEIESSKPIKASEFRGDTGSYQFDNSGTLSSTSYNIEFTDESRNKFREFITSTFDDTGSDTPVWLKKTALQTFSPQTLEDGQSGSFTFTAPTSNNVHFRKIIIKATTAGDGQFSFKFGSATGKTIQTLTTFTVESTEVGVEKTIVLNNALTLFQGDSIYVEYSGVNLRGHQFSSDSTWGDDFVPYFKTMSHTFSTDDIMTDSNIVGKLEAKTGNNRLSAGAIKDLPKYAHHTALHFNASSDEVSDTINAGDIVLETDIYTLDGVDYFGVVKDQGAHLELRLPRGVIIEDLAANARAEGNLFVEGGIAITSSNFLGRNISQGEKLYIEKTGTGATTKWQYTLENRVDTYELGIFIQPVNVSTGTYEVYANFALLRVKDIVEGISGVEYYKNDSGVKQFAGYGAVVSYESGNDDPVAIVPPSGQLPELFYLQDTESNAIGAFARNKTFEDVEVHGNGAIAHVQQLSQGDKIYYIPGLSKPEFTTTATSHKEAGFVVDSQYKYPITTTFDSQYANFNDVNISTAAQVNAHKNKTYFLPNKATNTTLGFAESNPVGTSEQNTAWNVGDTITFVNRANSKVTFDFEVDTGITFRNLAGNNITSYVAGPSTVNDQSVTLQVQSDRVWQIVAINEGVIANNVYISLEKMNNLRIKALEGQMGDITDLSANALRDYFSGGILNWDSNSQVTLESFTVRSEDNAVMIGRTTSSTLSLTSVGDNGLDTGSEASSTWYYVWAMYNTGNSEVQVRLSTSRDSPTFPSGFTKKRLLGAIYNDSSSNIRRFYMSGQRETKRMTWDGEVAVLSNAGATTRTNVDCSSQVPIIHGKYPHVNVIFEYRYNVSIYMSDSTNQHCYLHTQNNEYGTTTIPDLVLSSTGGFGYQASNGGAAIYAKVLCFDMEL